ncbi:MAG: hypothetical protein RQ824_03175 [bacterium]|nr:hypothetical protein [bacterium]
MKTIEKIRKGLPVALLGFIFLAFPGLAQAVGTNSGAIITNTVTVNYKVATVPQAPVTAVEDFAVDSKIAFTVTVDNANINVTPNSTGSDTLNIVKITATNTGNLTQNLRVTGIAEVDGFSAAGTVTYYLDDGDGVAEIGVDDAAQAMPYTFAALPEDGTGVLWAVLDVPIGALNTETFTVTPTVVSVDGADVALVDAGGNTHTAGGAVAGDVDIVIADAGLDNTESVTATYTVVTTALVMAKTVAVDATSPVPYFVPGAIVKYTVTVQNSSATVVPTDVVVTDTLPATLVLNLGSITEDGVGGVDTSAANTVTITYAAGIPVSTTYTITYLATIQ